MRSIIDSISVGFTVFPFFAFIFTLQIIAVQLVKYKSFNAVRIAMNYGMILYLLCVFSLVFLPLPDMAKAALLTEYKAQLVPFRFVADIVRESPLVITNVHTYIPAICNRAVLQVVLNVLMTVPFGMYLTYYYEYGAKKVATYTFLLSLFIEITQLTGIFFIYSGSYRLCDVDDLMANTLGGVLGYLIIRKCHFLPEIESFNRQLVKREIAVSGVK